MRPEPDDSIHCDYCLSDLLNFTSGLQILEVPSERAMPRRRWPTVAQTSGTLSVEAPTKNLSPRDEQVW